MNKSSSLQNLKSYQQQFSSSKMPKGKKVNKQFSIQGKLAAMQNTQRASGRRGN